MQYHAERIIPIGRKNQLYLQRQGQVKFISCTKANKNLERTTDPRRHFVEKIK
jgi:hypothetical protein